MSIELSDKSLGTGFNYGNFDPTQIDTEETINAVFVIDKSPSVEDYINELNDGLNDFVQTMQKSHVAGQLYVSTVTFCDKIKVEHGFKPIMNVDQFNVQPTGVGTDLYGATSQGLDIAIQYRNQLKQTGITCKTLVFIITDGLDNERSTDPNVVKQKIKDVLKDEENTLTFTTILFGVGATSGFEAAKDAMGIQHLAKSGTSGAEIRKLIGFISQSVSSGSVNPAAVSF